MARLDVEKQQSIEPQRIEYAKEKITQLGYEITSETDRSLEFYFRGHKVTFWPYSGWHSGKSIQDGRGLSNLIKQLKGI